MESIKYKCIFKFQLEDLELTSSFITKKLSIEKDFLEEDLNTITRINELVKNLIHPHQVIAINVDLVVISSKSNHDFILFKNLDESIREITISIIRQLNELNQTSTHQANNLQSNSLNAASNLNSAGGAASCNPAPNAANASHSASSDNSENKLKSRIVLTINTMLESFLRDIISCQ